MSSRVNELTRNNFSTVSENESDLAFKLKTDKKLGCYYIATVSVDSQKCYQPHVSY